MSLTVKFELSDEDLEHFRVLMREASAVASSCEEEQTVAAARAVLARVSGSDSPAFVRERLGTLRTLIAMIADEEWRLPDEERTRVVSALAYFSHPEGLIPDHIPGLGFLDDAIMIELVGHELQHEIEAYTDFCTFREKEAQRRRDEGESAGKITRKDWLNAKRAELHKRMRREAGGLRSLFSLFTG